MFDFITQRALAKLWKDWARLLESEVAEEFLETLLRLMQAVLLLSSDYRKNIKGFNGRYQFLSKDGGIALSAVFGGGRMRVKEQIIHDANVTVTFRNGRALMNFLLSPDQDILGAMLRHDVETDGNLNYIYRLGYLARRLQLMAPQP